jgi:multisubunit Na+/H+ antiporter MnhB subunit
LVLVGASLGLGVLVEVALVPLLDVALHKEVHLSLFMGFNLPLLLSSTVVVGGMVGFGVRHVWQDGLRRLWQDLNHLPSGAQVYQALLGVVERAGDLVLKAQGGKIRYYLAAIIGGASLILGTAGAVHLSEIDWAAALAFNGSIDIFRTLMIVLALGAMFASIAMKQHLLAALALGLAGYSVGGLFLVEPAPDVALVQFMVETVGTVLLVVMLGKISADKRQEAIAKVWAQSKPGLVRDALIATAVGVGVGLFALAAMLNRGQAQTVATWHLQNTYQDIKITDAVGAIVTDYRGMDTIIEITVFSMAALGVMTLLTKGLPIAAEQHQAPNLPFRDFKPLQSAHWRIFRSGHRRESHDLMADNAHQVMPTPSVLSTPLARVVAKLMLPFALVIALSHLLYGGDGPGDGFTAGVISGLGVAVWYIVLGYHESRERLQWLKPTVLIGAGVGVVLLNAWAPLAFGLPFLHHTSFDLWLPANLHLSSTFIYETGIFLCIFGSVAMIMETIAHPHDVAA